MKLGRAAMTEFKLIRIRPHGSEGYCPVVGSGCPLQANVPIDEHVFCGSCLSGSGSSGCMGNGGVVEIDGLTFVKCWGIGG